MARSRPEEELGFRWLETPAVYCDTYTADWFGDVIRIAFGEYTDRDHYPFFRTAVAIPLSDAKRLIRTLTRLVKEAEEPPKASETEEESSAGT